MKGVSGKFKAKVNKITGLSALKVSDFVDPPAGGTPGNVGICLSGGGSRAMTAGMGQLLGLKTLTNEKGNLLGQARSLSTVSGGSWVGVTFQYLKDNGCSDDDYLGPYTPASDLKASQLDQLPKTTIGYRCTSGFSPLHLFLELCYLLSLKVPKNLIWQNLVGHHILKYYGLYTPGVFSHTPNSLFTYNSETHKKDITGPNPKLADETAHYIASGPGRIRRPFLICNSSMFVSVPGTDYKYMVPVQTTPFFTGIVSTPPEATGADKRPVGGGGVTSFAFSSQLDSVSGDDVTVGQERQYSLDDAVGTSSAFFAEILENLGKKYSENPLRMFEDSAEALADVAKKVKERINPKKGSAFADILDKLASLKLTKKDAADHKVLLAHLEKVELDLERDLKPYLEDIKEIIPQFKYWPVGDLEPEPGIVPTRFADGGDLDNTGINATLCYSDVKNLIAFVNTSTPLKETEHGVIDEDGNEIAGSNVLVDSQVSILFGYQPYDKNSGYVLYREKGDGGEPGPFKKDIASPQYRYNQVFPADQFAVLLKGLKEATGPGLCKYGANYTQPLTTVENKWFGVAGGRDVKVLWVYNNFIESWYDQLEPDVKKVVDKAKADAHFPSFSTFKTELSKSDVTLFSNLTCWNLTEGSKQEFLDMFKDNS
ncbi:MAG: hypothetical protein GY765_01035 [bacterium]|nr:hypothetical protein [bacterium]